MYRVILLLFLLSNPAFDTSVAADPFKVGVITPLSGPVADLGVAAKNGIELARTEDPSKFKDIEFIYEDSQYDGKKAIAAFNKLRNSNKVDLIFNWGTEPARVLAPLADQAGFPLIVLSHDPSTVENRESVIRFINPGEEFSKVQATWLKRMGYKRIAAVRAELTYLNSIFDGVKRHLSPEQSIEVIDSYSTSDNDFRSTIAKLRTKKFDALGVFLLGGQASEFYKQAKEQRLNLPSFGTDALDSTKEVSHARGAMDGAVFSNVAVSRDFQARYTERFKNDFHVAFAGNSYDFAMLVSDLFGNSTSKLRSKEILTAISSVEARNGVLGAYQFTTSRSGDQYFAFPIVMRRVEGGEIVTIGNS